MSNTKVPQYLAAKIVDNKAISLAVQHTNVRIKLFGSTMPMSAQCTGDYDKLSQVTIYPEQGKDGIVAVAVDIVSQDRKGYSRSEYIPAFLKVSWKQKGEQTYPFIDLDEPWIPADRIGQVTHEAVEVMLKGGRRFSSRDNFKYDTNKGKDLPRFVPDGNLLCRYLWGTAHAADVLHAVVQEKVKSLEPTAVKRVEELTNELRQLQDKKDREVEKLLEKARFQEKYWVLAKHLVQSIAFYRKLNKMSKYLPIPWSLRGFVNAMEYIHNIPVKDWE